ncbi:MAG: putative caspase-like protein, partial [Pseudomonadota bacterium]
MKSWLSRLSAALLAVVCVASAAPAQAEKRIALVIGNNDYRNVPKLQKAVNDARTMGDTLKQLGFNVMLAENLNRQAFSETLLAFDRAVEPGDTAFFFYAGHG